MRLDKFLKVTQIIKRRTMANEAADEGFIKVNGKAAKPALKIKEGDCLEIDMWNYYKKIKVVALPQKGSVAKADLEKYIALVEYKTKEPEF